MAFWKKDKDDSYDTLSDYDAYEFTPSEQILFSIKEDLLGYLIVQCQDGGTVDSSILTFEAIKMVHIMTKFEMFGTTCSEAESNMCIINPWHRQFDYKETDLARMAKAVFDILIVKEREKDKKRREEKRKSSRPSISLTKNFKALMKLADDSKKNKPSFRPKVTIKRHVNLVS
jgi:hypothetical protein